jgi:hypothetical protein
MLSRILIAPLLGVAIAAVVLAPAFAATVHVYNCTYNTQTYTIYDGTDNDFAIPEDIRTVRSGNHYSNSCAADRCWVCQGLGTPKSSGNCNAGKGDIVFERYLTTWQSPPDPCPPTPVGSPAW